MIIKPALLSGNHTSGRRGHRPEAIVIHIIEGTLASADSWFRNPAAQVSAHYGVSRAGEVVQWVRDEDTAWANGRVHHPTAEMVLERPGVNPNLWTLSVEHEGFAHSEPTSELLKASGELLAHLSAKHAIPLDRQHVIPHRDIYSKKSCPGRLEVDELLRMALPPEGEPRAGARRWSNYFGEYLVLTRFVSDEEWYFLRESQLAQTGLQANVPWSEMPREP